MIVLSVLLTSLVQCWQLRGFEYGSNMRTTIIMEGLVVIIMWIWGLKYSILSRGVWMAFYGMRTFQRSAGLLPDLHRSIPRQLYIYGIVIPGQWFQMLCWLSFPFFPFTFIWIFLTPLQHIAPVVTFYVIRCFVGIGLIIASTGSVFFTLFQSSLFSETVISMLHRSSMFTSMSGPLKLISPGLCKRANASYIKTVHISDISLSFLPSSSPSKFLSVCKDIAKLNPDIIFISGALFSHDYCCLCTVEERRDVLKECLEPLKGFKLFCCFPDSTPQELRSVLNSIGGVFTSEKLTTFMLGEVNISIGGFTSDGVAIPKYNNAKNAKNLAILLAPNPQLFDSMSWPKGVSPYHLTLASGYLGGMVGIAINSKNYSLTAGRILSHLTRTIVPTFGLWGKGPARLHVSPGFGSSSQSPMLPCLRLGVPAAVSILHVEIPER